MSDSIINKYLSAEQYKNVFIWITGVTIDRFMFYDYKDTIDFDISCRERLIRVLKNYSVYEYIFVNLNRNVNLKLDLIVYSFYWLVILFETSIFFNTVK